jgi:ASC-1-like (ASCH) protein
VFTCEDRSVLMRVVGLHVYPDFVELYDALPKTMLGYLEDEVANPKDMLEYYDPDMIREYGVVGIEIEPYNQM